MIVNKLRNGFLALAVLMIASCTEEKFDQPRSADEGREAMVTLRLSTAPETTGMPGTRGIENETIDEGTDPDYKVEDFWLVQYNGAGYMLGSPRYFTKRDFAGDKEITIPVILPTVDNIAYKCVIIANTHSEGFHSTLTNANTIDKLKAIAVPVKEQKDLFITDSESGDSHKCLLMNSVTEVTNQTERLDCELYRNVAKLTLKLENKTNSKVKITSVQLRNVADRMFVADRLYDGAATPSPTTEESSFMNMPIENHEISEGGNTELKYYLPRNMRGKSSNQDPMQKNVNAPDYATFVEIMAEDTDKKTPLRYRFYLGADMKNDFNVEPNHHYTLPITIVDKGNAFGDSRVEDLGEVKLAEANSYIINPTVGEAQTVYSVPITRINTFWKSEHVYDHAIGVNDEWIAEVLWQDQPALIEFYAEDGTPVEKFNGKGDTFFHFRPKQGAKGNVLIGVRIKNTGAYLWSWHLWITDYNPDYTFPWKKDTYSYPVEGGHVYRYADKPGSTLIWDNKYNGKYIMDRNLGASTADASLAAHGLYYQFGRKDPFPAPATQLYDINGKKLPQTSGNTDCIQLTKDKTTLIQSVNIPYAFNYIASSTYENWMSDNKYHNEVWNNPDWHNSEDKSLFDPCPPGWKLPEAGAYDIFQAITGDPNASNYDALLGDNGFNSNEKDAGWHFYMNAEGKGETTFFPAAGSRIPSINNLYSAGYFWTSTPDNENSAKGLYIYSGGATQFKFNRMHGLSVRCVQDDSK